MVPAGDAEGCLFSGGVEYVAAKKAVKLGKGDFQFAADGLAFGGQVIAAWPADEKVILKHPSQPLQRAAHRWLAQKQPGCRAGDRSFFRKGGEDHEQIQVGLP
jgi:hypothetical protein